MPNLNMQDSPATSGIGYRTQAIATLGYVTALELVRSRVLVVALGIGVLATCAGQTGSALAIFAHGRIVADFVLSAIHLLVLGMAIGAGQGLVARDLDAQSASVVLAHPMGRGTWLVGRYVGLCGVISLQIALMAAVIFFLGLLCDVTWPKSFGASLLVMPMVGAVAAAVAMVLTCITARPIALTATLTLLGAGYCLDAALQYVGQRPGAFAQGCARIVPLVVPQMQLLSLQAYVANDLSAPPYFVSYAWLYAATYSTLVLGLGCVLIARRRAI